MAVTTAPDPQKISAWRARRCHRRSTARSFILPISGAGEWYEPQLRFFAAGASITSADPRRQPDRQMFAAAYEAGLHMTGQYPDGGRAGASASRPAAGSSDLSARSFATARKRS